MWLLFKDYLRVAPVQRNMVVFIVGSKHIRGCPYGDELFTIANWSCGYFSKMKCTLVEHKHRLAHFCLYRCGIFSVKSGAENSVALSHLGVGEL